MRAQEDGSAGKSMKQNTSGYLLALLAVVIWSGNFVVARAVADMIPTMVLVMPLSALWTNYIAPLL